VVIPQKHHIQFASLRPSLQAATHKRQYSLSLEFPHARCFSGVCACTVFVCVSVRERDRVVCVCVWGGGGYVCVCVCVYCYAFVFCLCLLVSRMLHGSYAFCLSEHSAFKFVSSVSCACVCVCFFLCVRVDSCCVFRTAVSTCTNPTMTLNSSLLVHFCVCVWERERERERPLSVFLSVSTL
jgi:hypothetical protein